MRDVKQVPTVESTAVLRMLVARDRRDVVRAIGWRRDDVATRYQGTVVGHDSSLSRVYLQQ